MRCHAQNLRRRIAFTLVEMMISVGIGSLFVGAIVASGMFTARSFAALGNYADLDRASRNALDNLSRDLRQATHLVAWSPQSITVTNSLMAAVFTYTWDPTAKTLSRSYTSGGVTTTTVLLTGCITNYFDVCQRNPGTNFTFISCSNNPTLTKLVDVSWKCSRNMLGRTNWNTESVQTARVVIRN